MTTLTDQVDEFSKNVKTEVQFYSIGEIVRLYENNELIINPNFQRLYRWEKQQKTDFIESLLLGIPTPSIFVSERDDGKWELIDGLQRISTILEFMGLLKEENLPLQKINLINTGLLRAPYLTYLEGIGWDSLEDSLKIKIQRTRININVITKDSDESTKYEVFNRLNTGGASLTNQEVRNTLLLQFGRPFYDFLMELKEYDHFQNVINLSDKDIEREADTELILRFFSVKNYNLSSDGKIRNVSSFITLKMNDFIKDGHFDYQKEREVFIKTFKLLDETLGAIVFKRYYEEKGFYGRIVLPGFDAIASGIGFNIKERILEDIDREILQERIQELWSMDIFNKNIAVGKTTESKLLFCEEFGKAYFNFI